MSPVASPSSAPASPEWRRPTGWSSSAASAACRSISPCWEAARRPGGSIGTERTDGFVIEAGPDSFISEKPAALQLCERIGLTPRLVRTRDENRRTYVVHGGRLHSLPDGFLLLAPTQFWPLLTTRLFTWPGKLRMGLDLVLPRGPQRSDESLGSFVTRRLGREALERVAQPLIGGIYTADPDDLSLAATMPRFLEMERKHRSVILAMWRAIRQQPATSRATSGARWSLFVSVDDGMQTLIDTLAQRLPEGVLRCGAGLTSVGRESDALAPASRRRHLGRGRRADCWRHRRTAARRCSGTPMPRSPRS